jgi:glycosyltransferase involved in cell wall biosynthesis
LPLVSIAIAAYNHEKFIGDTLLSIKRQNLSDYEIVIVDDCSSDLTCACIEYHAQKFNLPVKLFRNSRNQGILKTIKKATELITGKYLCIFSSDDIYLDNGLTLLLTALEKNEEAVVVYCNGRIVRGCEQPNGEILKKKEIDILSKGGQETLFYLWTEIPRLFLQSTMMRTDFFQLIGGFPVNARAEDWTLNIKIFEGIYRHSKKYLFMPFSYNFAYRQHNANTSKNIAHQVFNTVYTAARFVPKELRHLCLSNIYDKYWEIYERDGDLINAERCQLLYERHHEIYQVNPFQGGITLR